jgi:hypothetical protein
MFHLEQQEFIGFWRKLSVLHYDNNNRGFTRLSNTNKTID